MALGTVSFEELLGHCNEVYKTNQKYIEDRMKTFGYVSEMELDNDDDDSEFLSPKIGSKRLNFSCGSVSAARSNGKKLEEELLFEDFLSLQTLGLSDACLATLASEDGGPCKIKTAIKILKDDYDSLPSYMKSLAS